ncbi:hypothetical protein P691DRAFT_768373 [Macrolepiota fuliginosa MF-IS2]|uniref:Ricin B lectin domain-containing protein n=1 Tax=Macrolepiota fuliginosa MF-IS2 TaxID=1400762 RepID=A0A9P6BUI2_9AGAR|nr:hypothetical protein P691DRAFT_768373 [Macrolepiota fuliginosa MF-IS2]
MFSRTLSILASTVVLLSFGGFTTAQLESGNLYTIQSAVGGMFVQANSVDNPLTLVGGLSTNMTTWSAHPSGSDTEYIVFEHSAGTYAYFQGKGSQTVIESLQGMIWKVANTDGNSSYTISTNQTFNDGGDLFRTVHVDSNEIYMEQRGAQKQSQLGINKTKTTAKSHRWNGEKTREGSVEAGDKPEAETI